MTICFALTLVLVNSIMCLSLQENIEKFHGIGCKVDRHFHSSLITPLVEQATEVTGCLSSDSSSGSQEVYVLSLLSSGFNEPTDVRTGYLPSVSVDIRPHWKQKVLATNTVIILHSLTPVMWQMNLQHVENSTNFNVIVNKPSYVVPSITVSVSRQKIPSMKRLTMWVTSRYGAITSFSTISVANKITLLIGSDIHASEDCDFSSKAQSINVKAAFIQPQPASGCSVNNNQTGEKRLRSLHIVELNSSMLSGDILIHLQPHTESEVTQRLIVEQNLVLVLKCHVPTEWIVESIGIQGSLHVVAEYPVHIRTNPMYITAMVQEKVLPVDTSALLNEVQTSFGPIDSYMKTAKANRINMGIKGKILKYNSQGSKNEDKASFPVSSLKSPQLPSGSELLYSVTGNKLKVQEAKSNVFLEQPLSLLLAKQMILECFDDKMTIIFSFDETMDILTSAIGTNSKLSSVTLSDMNCKAELNESHIVLHSDWNGCGTRSLSDEEGLVYHNQVQFITVKYGKDSSTAKKPFPTDDDDLSEDGSGADDVLSFRHRHQNSDERMIYPLPFHCSQSFTRTTNTSLTSVEKYELNIFLKKDFQHPVLEQSFPLEVAANDHIFAETTIKADPRLCIIVDECWLSEDNGFNIKTNKKNILIKQGCSTDLSVEILAKSHCGSSSTNSHHRLRFSFQMSEDFINQNIHLHCRLSACARKDSKQMKVKQCINTENFCLDQSLRPYLDIQRGKKFDLVARGPFQVTHKQQVDKEKELLFFANPVESSSSPESFVVDYSFDKLTGPNKKNPISQQLIFIGLSTEAVVGIAFASFIIGAGLMATLWLIHMHTEPSRRSKRHRKHSSKRSHLSYQCEGQLNYDHAEHIDSSVPCSLKPMSVHICS